MDLIIEELSLVIAGVQKLEDTLAGFCSIFVLPLVFFTIWPLLYSKSILLVVFPFTDIFGSV
jgi:hypothetical protein